MGVSASQSARSGASGGGMRAWRVRVRRAGGVVMSTRGGRRR